MDHLAESERQTTLPMDRVKCAPLNGELPVLDLPTDRPRVRVERYRMAEATTRLSVDLTQRLRLLGQQKELTPFIILSAGFSVLLHRYSGQTQIAVGTSVTRQMGGPKGVAGPCADTLAISTDLSGDPTFLEVARCGKELFGVLLEQGNSTGNPAVERESHSEERSRPQVRFGWGNRGNAGSGLKREHAGLGNDTSDFELELQIHDTGECFEASWKYSVELFECSTILRLAGYFERLLGDVAHDPLKRISQLELLSSAERQHLLLTWNDSARPNGDERCVHQLFEEQVEKTPDAVAVGFDGCQMTYRELNEKANQLAHYLQSRGVGVDHKVGICLGRSFELVIGLLGVLKAGAAYVPMDPAYPSERLEFMLAEANASIVLTQEQVLPRLGPRGEGALCLDTGWKEVALHSKNNPSTAVGAGNLIYVIYTSGSTGRPKGAGVFHRGFTNLLKWFVDEFEVGSRDNLLVISSISFDLTQKTIYAPLVRGGQLHLLASEYYDPELIAQNIRDHRITLLNCTPSAFYPVLETAVGLNGIASLRRVFLGGETISIPRVRKWLASPECRGEIVNTYGPTECTDICASYRLTRKNLDTYPSVPIGRPIYNVRLAVMNEGATLCLPGAKGELCIAGEGVGAGYINDAALTAQKFIRNPFPELKSQLLYRTGDLVRYLPDGNIEFLGRIDHQVKVRGFRIELGEIEAALGTHQSLADVVVLAREDEQGEKQLVAYAVSNKNAAPSTEELRTYMEERLPEYMVPSVFILLEKMPLSPNGKVDRKRLPAPGRRQSRVAYVEARPGTETILAKIWGEVLKLDRVGIKDDFFQLGGHSLKAVQLAGRIRDRLAVDVKLSDLFRASTVESQAALCDSLARNPIRSEAATISSHRTMSLGQEYRWGRSSAAELRRSDSNVVMVMRITGRFQPQVAGRVLQILSDRHESLRTAFVEDGGELKMKVFPPEEATVIFKEYRPLDLQTPGVGPAYQPLDLFVVPLLHGGYAQESADAWTWFISLSHLATDGWSSQILMDEFWQMYDQLSHLSGAELLSAHPARSGEPMVPYSEFVHWESAQIAAEKISLATAQRIMQLQTARGTMTISLPTDSPRECRRPTDVGDIWVAVEPDLTRRLKEWAAQERIGLLALMLTPFALLLRALTAQERFTLGSVSAGRSLARFEDTVGYFMNLVPLVLDAPEGGTVRELAQGIQRSVLEAMDCDRVPFKILFEELADNTSPSASQGGQIFFYLQKYGRSDQVSSCPRDFCVESLPEHIKSVKDDITVQAYDGAEIRLRWLFDGGLFHKATIQKWIHAYKVLLQQIPGNEQIPVKTILNHCHCELRRN